MTETIEQPPNPPPPTRTRRKSLLRQPVIPPPKPKKRNGGAEPAYEVPHKHHGSSGLPKKKRVSSGPRPLPLKERKKLLARKAARPGGLKGGRP